MLLDDFICAAQLLRIAVIVQVWVVAEVTAVADHLLKWLVLLLSTAATLVVILLRLNHLLNLHLLLYVDFAQVIISDGNRVLLLLLLVHCVHLIVHFVAELAGAVALH